MRILKLCIVLFVLTNLTQALGKQSVRSQGLISSLLQQQISQVETKTIKSLKADIDDYDDFFPESDTDDHLLDYYSRANFVKTIEDGVTQQLINDESKSTVDPIKRQSALKSFSDIMTSNINTSITDNLPQPPPEDNHQGIVAQMDNEFDYNSPNDLDDYGNYLIQHIKTQLDNQAAFDPSINPSFRLNAEDDDEIIRTDSGIYQIEYYQDKEGMFKDDFDSEMDELQQEVDEMAKDLDEAAKDLDEDLRRDKNDYDELHSIRKRGNSYLTDDQKDEMDDLAENILDVVSDFQKDQDEYRSKELEMFQNDIDDQYQVKLYKQDMEKDELGKMITNAMEDYDLDDIILPQSDEGSRLHQDVLNINRSYKSSMNIDYDETDHPIGQAFQSNYLLNSFPAYYDNPDDGVVQDADDVQRLQSALAQYYRQYDGDAEVNVVLDSSDYMTREILLQDYDDEIPVFTSDSQAIRMQGDLRDNKVTDQVNLTRVGALDGAQIKSWQMISDADDSDDYLYELKSSNNPNVIYRNKRDSNEINQLAAGMLVDTLEHIQILLQTSGPQTEQEYFQQDAQGFENKEGMFQENDGHLDWDDGDDWYNTKEGLITQMQKLKEEEYDEQMQEQDEQRQEQFDYDDAQGRDEKEGMFVKHDGHWDWDDSDDWYKSMGKVEVLKGQNVDNDNHDLQIVKPYITGQDQIQIIHEDCDDEENYQAQAFDLYVQNPEYVPSSSNTLYLPPKASNTSEIFTQSDVGDGRIGVEFYQPQVEITTTKYIQAKQTKILAEYIQPERNSHAEYISSPDDQQDAGSNYSVFQGIISDLVEECEDQEKQADIDDLNDSDEKLFSNQTNQQNNVDTDDYDEQMENYDKFMGTYDQDESNKQYHIPISKQDKYNNPATKIPSIYFLQKQNPINFLQKTLDATNPVYRDQDELPDDLDDKGDEKIEGDTLNVIVTSFIEGERQTGKVWVVPSAKSKRNQSYTLIQGLERPTGTCFDINHNLLYVTDIGYGDYGYIYQYEISWSSKGRFNLKRDLYTIVYEGKTPSDCTVDGYGNLYFVDTDLNSIFSIGYLDLWGGFKNQQYVLYKQSEGQSNIQMPIALDVYDSKELYFINNKDCENIGLLNHVSAIPTGENSEHIEITVREPLKGWGVAYTESDYVFYSQSNGDVWAIDANGDKERYIKSTDFFRDPRGLCYGDGKVYVADYEKGEVYFLHDNDKVNEKPKEFVKIQGAYGLYCVNYDHDSSVWLIITWVTLLLI